MVSSAYFQAQSTRGSLGQPAAPNLARVAADAAQVMPLLTPRIIRICILIRILLRILTAVALRLGHEPGAYTRPLFGYT
jgi:hypothetical protein